MRVGQIGMTDGSDFSAASDDATGSCRPRSKGIPCRPASVLVHDHFTITAVHLAYLLKLEWTVRSRPLAGMRAENGSSNEPVLSLTVILKLQNHGYRNVSLASTRYPLPAK